MLYIIIAILMFGLRMDIAGAGLSTALSQLVSWGILLGMFLTGRTETKISLRRAALGRPALVGNIMATGFPSLIRQGLNSLSTVLLNAQCAPYGDAAVAGMSIVSRLVFFAFSLALGVGQGFQPVSGFNYGAGRYRRLRKAYRFTALTAEGIIVVTCGALVLFSGSLIGVFRDDPAVIRIGTRALRLQMATVIFLPFTMCNEMLYQSTGHRFGASFLSSARSGLFFIPALLLLSAWRRLPGIQEAQPAAYLLAVPLSATFVIRFMRRLPGEDAKESG